MIKLELKYYPVPPEVKEDLTFMNYHPADATLLATIENSGFLHAGGSGFDGAWSGFNYDQIDEEARYFLEDSLWDGPESVKNELIAYINEWYDQEVYEENNSVPFNDFSDAAEIVKRLSASSVKIDASKSIHLLANEVISTYMDRASIYAQVEIKR